MIGYAFLLFKIYEIGGKFCISAAHSCYKKDEVTHIFFYRYACRGLFERHKLLFSFQMCVKILENANKINTDEYSFFLRGGVVSLFNNLTIYSYFENKKIDI